MVNEGFSCEGVIHGVQQGTQVQVQAGNARSLRHHRCVWCLSIEPDGTFSAGSVGGAGSGPQGTGQLLHLQHTDH